MVGRKKVGRERKERGRGKRRGNGKRERAPLSFFGLQALLSLLGSLRSPIFLALPCLTWEPVRKLKLLDKLSKLTVSTTSQEKHIVQELNIKVKSHQLHFFSNLPSTSEVSSVTCAAFLLPAGSDRPIFSNLSRKLLPPFLDLALK